MALIEVWAFVLVIYNLTMSEGFLRATLEAPTKQGCENTRQFILDQVGGEKNLKGSITKCEEKK